MRESVREDSLWEPASAPAVQRTCPLSALDVAVSATRALHVGGCWGGGETAEPEPHVADTRIISDATISRTARRWRDT